MDKNLTESILNVCKILNKDIADIEQLKIVRDKKMNFLFSFIFTKHFSNFFLLHQNKNPEYLFVYYVLVDSHFRKDG